MEVASKPFPFQNLPPTEASWPLRLARGLVISGVTSLSKVWMQVLNETRVYNSGRLTSRVRNLDRAPLLTVMNHTSIVDDP
eukprot:CAMPEP_0196796206 /NCGR_PEP_ID=MMETSP1104-20130614/37208_1 /TAXON_ID=33652 /ORGANISM="Cafeteria sp., Strain Caron Lab Isolate" /LENGTH=80 /DNA_ID=CAMNT_0042166599 /DNA_START=69 /DNA_END=308 /DNA_ORIENTATION=-